MRITPNNIQELQPNEVFVFGSNLEGKHYAGAAKLAHEKFGAVFGHGIGFGRNYKSYAIPSMNGIDVMAVHVKKFISKTMEMPNKIFLVTEIGCGIAGYNPEQIAPLFKEATELPNIYLPKRFWEVLNK